MWYTKLKRYGLCDLHDWRIDGSGKRCQMWKGVKFNRKDLKIPVDIKD